MIKIAIVTATRAEYGLLNPVIRKLRSYETSDLKVEVIVTGTHLKNNMVIQFGKFKKIKFELIIGLRYQLNHRQKRIYLRIRLIL